jgi:hypothetical protein
MNKGSAAKWCEMLLSGNYALNDGLGLRYSDNTFCIAGVLEDFASAQTWTLNESLCSYENADGSPLSLSKNVLSRCKIKVNKTNPAETFSEVYEFHRQNPGRDVAFYADWINANYERF